MKNLIIIVLLAVVAYFLFLREDNVPAHDGTAFAPALVPTPAASALLFFTEKNIDVIFGPLELSRASTTTTRRRRAQVQEEEKKIIPAAAFVELNAIQEALQTAQIPTLDERQRRIYAAANSLCRQLYSAIAERNEHMKRLTHTRNNPSESTRSAKENQHFFENSIKNSWYTKAEQMRREIQKNYNILRDLEKSII